MIRINQWPLWLVVVAWILTFDLSLILSAWLLPPLAQLITPQVGIDRLLSVLGTLIGTFVGAWLAFNFAKKGKEFDRIQSEVAAGNRALFILSRMISGYAQHQSKVTGDFRGRQDAWLNLPVSPPLRGDLQFDFKELSFVMQHEAGVFQTVMLEEDRYRQYAQLVEDHRVMIFDQTWPRLQDAGLKIGDEGKDEEIRDVVGPGLFRRLEVTTAALISHVDENLASSQVGFKGLRVALKQIHPNAKFIDFKLTEPPPPKPTLTVLKRSTRAAWGNQPKK